MRISDWSSDVCSSDLVPRNVVITGAASVTSVTFTITGTDVFGDDLVETITGPTGATAASGKKAFKTVTAIAVSATTTAAVTVGTGDVLGLPVYLPSSGAVLKELQDGASATAGRSEEHTSELQSLMRITYAVFCLKKK